MWLCLQVSEREGGKGYSSGRRFGFAVIDLDAQYLKFQCGGSTWGIGGTEIMKFMLHPVMTLITL
jgi:hypothetical protein